MTKADIVNEITKNTGIDKTTVLTTVEAFMDAVKASLSKDENVYLRGFGSFVVKKRAQKTARNISKTKKRYRLTLISLEEFWQIIEYIIQPICLFYPNWCLHY